MLHLVLLQLATTVFTSVIAGLVGGVHALISAFLGGLCCVVPNGLFALRLAASSRKSGFASPTAFFMGELAKIGLTITFLGVVIWQYHDLHWLALIAAFVVALKSYIFLLFRH